MLPSLNNLTKFSCYQTGLGNEGFQRLSTFLKQNTSLVNLFLGGDKIDDVSVASSFSDALKNHPNLQVVILGRCGLSDADILGVILEGCKRLAQISMALEELGSASVALLADFICCNNPTELMILNHTNISDNDTSLLASALKYNTNLKRLNLKYNDITDTGEKTLLNALYDPTSMKSIVESNHTCKAYTHDTDQPSIVAQRPPIETEVLNINDDRGISIQQKIRRKVVLALCGVEGELFDLSHLNDLPLQLMPRVLELVQKHSQSRSREVRTMPNQLEKDALTRLFHTLRGWELPLLFENLRVSSATGTTGKRKRKARGTGKRSCRR